MKESLEKVMRKLAKLKKLYESAKVINSQGEAEAAAFKINQLLTEYNLTMDEIGSEEEKEANTVIHENVSGYTYKSIGGKWEQYLTHVICKWNFCQCYKYGTYIYLIIVGERQNIEIVKWLVNMLKERFVAFSKDRYKEYLNNLPEWEKPMSKDRFQRNYLLGAARGLDFKLQQEHEKEKKEEQELANQINALVVRKNAAIVEYVNNVWGRVKTSRERGCGYGYNAAQASGYKDGINTSLNKPIAGGRTAAESVKMLN